MMIGKAAAAAAGGSVVCAGLSCLDLQLLGCTRTGSDEAIERYDEAVHCAGGSASMTATALALLLRPRDDDDSVVANTTDVYVLTKVGPDFAGSTLREFYERAGAKTDLVLVDPDARTSMAVLPVFRSDAGGGRGCFVNLACNDGFGPDELLGRLDEATKGEEGKFFGEKGKPVRAFLFGYPHLMPKMQGEALRDMLGSARRKLEGGEVGGRGRVLVGVDLNGVDGSDANAADAALRDALSQIDVLHLNEEEATVLASAAAKEGAGDIVVGGGIRDDVGDGDDAAKEDEPWRRAPPSLHSGGCACVLLSLGSRGAFISVTPDADRLQKCPPPMCDWEPGARVRVPAYRIVGGEANANGAGDALFAGFCLAASSWGAGGGGGGRGEAPPFEVTPLVAGTFASLVARQRCDARTRDGDGADAKGATELMEMIRTNDLPEEI